jgi:serine/threonine protein kinase
MKAIAKARLNDPCEYFNEAKHLYASTHQNVVQVHYACEDDDHVYIAMPLYAKGSVKGLMADRRLTVREVIRLGCQLLAGLHNIHSKGLIHFDIKPDNILLSNRREALISDFGLAKQMYFGQAEPDMLYTPMAPPEHLVSPPFDLRFDIYQVGLTLYRMINGNEEFDRQFSSFCDQAGQANPERLSDAILQGRFPDRDSYGEHVPVKMRRIIKKCIEVRPEDRFRSALAVANALASVEDCLDWRPMPDPVNRVWCKNEGGTEKRFVVNHDGSTEFTSTHNGKVRRTRDLCKGRMTKREIEATLKNH